MVKRLGANLKATQIFFETDSPLLARLRFLSGSTPPLDPHFLQHNTPCSPLSGRIVGNDGEPAELSASWCYFVSLHLTGEYHFKE